LVTKGTLPRGQRPRLYSKRGNEKNDRRGQDRTGCTKDWAQHRHDPLLRETGINRESARTEGGFRLFGSGEIETLKFVRKAQELGFSLSEIRELLILRADKTSEWFVQPDSRRRGIPESGKRLCESS